MDEPMNAELMTIFARLVSSEDRVDLIEQIDFQLAAYKKSPKHYILPNACKWMTAALEEFAEDQESWLAFVRKVRREFIKRTNASMALGKIYRKVYSRVDQVTRRERIALAVQVYLDTHGEFVDREEEKLYVKRLLMLWKIGRDNAKAEYRRKVGSDRLTYDEQCDAFDEYWKGIAAELEAGKVPHKDELPQLIETARRKYRIYFGKDIKD